MKKEIAWGGTMAIVGISTFAWSSYGILYHPKEKPQPTTKIFSNIKPSITPIVLKKDLSEKIINAKSAIKFGQYEHAINILEKEKKSSESLKVLILASIKQGIYVNAKDYSNELLKIEKTEKNILQHIHILLLQGKTDEAKKYFKEINESSEKIFYELIISVSENKNDIAKDLANKLLKDEKYNKISLLFINTYKTYDSFRDGSPAYLKTMLANVLKTLQYHAITINYIKPVLETNPEYRDAWLVIGNSYLILKKFEIAERMFEKALSLDPSHPISPYLLGVTLYELDQEEDAIKQIENAIKNGYKDKIQAQRYIADIYFQEKKYDKSLEYYQKIFNTEKSQLSDYTKGVYITLKELKTPKLGEILAQEAIKKEPNNPAALSLKGWSLLENGKKEEAKEFLEDLIKKYPNSLETLLYLGKTYEKYEDIELHKKAFFIYKKCYEKGKGNAISIECAKRYEDLRIKKVESE
jgi:tetratricopeptide (TPR) repeat protein